MGRAGKDLVEDVSFDVRAGEILGFFGLVDAGRAEVAEMLFGITKPHQIWAVRRKLNGSKLGRSFLQTPEIRGVLRAAERVTIAHEKEEDAQTQAQSDAEHSKQAQRARG